LEEFDVPFQIPSIRLDGVGGKTNFDGEMIQKLIEEFLHRKLEKRFSPSGFFYLTPFVPLSMKWRGGRG